MAVINSILDSDIYNIVDIVNGVKSQYVDEDEETLAMGIYGYIGAIESVKIQAAVQMCSELSNEVFPNRAKYDRNIMTHAMMYDVDDVLATPAEVGCIICLRMSDFNKYQVNNKFTLDRKSSFYIGDYEYHLYYDIIITKVNISGKGSYVCTARYDNTYPNALSHIDNPYLAAPTVLVWDNVEYICIQCELYQITLSSVYKKLLTSSLIDNKTFTFTYDQQLADFTVCVTENGKTTELTPIYEGATPDPGVDKYCYYLMIDRNTIRIKFERVSYSPKLNAQIEVKLQLTKGKDGVFRYNEDRAFSNIQSADKSYSNVQTMILLQTDSLNGLDAKTPDELRDIIPKEALARGAITTSADLNAYFNQLNTSDNRLILEKKVDNQTERTYYAHLLMKDSNNDIVPTNTIKLNIRLADFPIIVNKRYVLPAGSVIEYDSNTGIGSVIYTEINDRVVNNDISDYVLSLTAIKSGSKTENYAIGTIPANIAGEVEISKTSLENLNAANNRYGTILMQTDRSDENLEKDAKTTGVEVDDGDVLITDPTYLTVSNTTKVRTIYDSDVDKFIYWVTDTEDFTIDDEDYSKFYYVTPYTIVVNADHELYSAYYLCVVNENLKLNFSYINPKSDIQFICNSIHWYRKFISDKNTYKLDMTIVQNIQEDMDLYKEDIVKMDGKDVTVVLYNKVRVFALLYRDGKPYRYKEAEFVHYNPGNYSFTYQFKFDTNNILLDSANNIRIENVGVVGQSIEDYGYFEGNTKTEIYVLIKSDEEAGRYDLDQYIPGLDGYIVSNKYTVINGVDFFINYSGVMASKIDVKNNGKNEPQSFLVNSLPVIRYKYAMNESLIDDFIDCLNIKKAYIDAANIKMENSFGVDFKLFNTYGPSRLFTLDNGDTFIHRVNVALHFKLRLKSAYDVYTKDYVLNYVKEYIEDLNDTGSLHMSNLTTSVENKYKDSIIFFEFVGFDEYGPGTQHLYKMDLDYVNKVPEFININMLIDKDGNKTPDIDIKLV